VTLSSIIFNDHTKAIPHLQNALTLFSLSQSHRLHVRTGFGPADAVIL
jgi:hypothetical protein